MSHMICRVIDVPISIVIVVSISSATMRSSKDLCVVRSVAKPIGKNIWSITSVKGQFAIKRTKNPSGATMMTIKQQKTDQVPK